MSESRRIGVRTHEYDCLGSIQQAMSRGRGGVNEISVLCCIAPFVSYVVYCGTQDSTVANGSMIGMKSVLEGASVEESAIVAAGAIVMPGTVVGAGQVPVPRFACRFFLPDVW